jgi:hypothetical protein
MEAQTRGQQVFRTPLHLEVESPRQRGSHAAEGPAPAGASQNHSR